MLCNIIVIIIKNKYLLCKIFHVYNICFFFYYYFNLNGRSIYTTNCDSPKFNV